VVFQSNKLSIHLQIVYKAIPKIGMAFIIN